MKKECLVQAVLMVISATCAFAQPVPAPAVPLAATASSNAPAPVLHSVVLSNQTVQVLSKLRQINASAVKLKFGKSMTGAFEIDVAGANDLKREAELLSKNFGFGATVILDEAASNGQNRTNYAFRNGELRQAIMPIEPSQLQPGAKRMYVWPASPDPVPANNLRVVPGSSAERVSK